MTGTVDAFDADAVARLRRACDDLAWLLGRGYAPASSLKLVGDRHDLVERQRAAVARATCSEDARARRATREIHVPALAGRSLDIDGLNLVTTLEVAAAGGVVLACRDGSYRDLASVHGAGRRVAATPELLELAGDWLAGVGVVGARWLLDRPVSHSGRVAALLREVAARRGWRWEVELVDSPDRELIASPHVVATADSGILDRAAAWTSLARHIVVARIPAARVIDLQGEGG